MPSVSFPYTLLNGTVNDADEVMANFNQLKYIVEHLDSGNFASTALLNATTHGFVNTSSPMHKGAAITIADPNNYWTDDTVQGIADQIGALVGTGGSLSGTSNYPTRYYGNSFHATTAASCTVTVPAGTAAHGFKVTASAYLNDYNGSGAGLSAVAYLRMASDVTSVVDLSSTASRKPEFEMKAVGGGADGGCTVSNVYIIDSNITTKSNWAVALDLVNRAYTFTLNPTTPDGGSIATGDYKLVVEVF